MTGGKGPLLAVANDKGKITILSNLSRNIEHKRRATITVCTNSSDRLNSYVFREVEVICKDIRTQNCGLLQLI